MKYLSIFLIFYSNTVFAVDLNDAINIFENVIEEVDKKNPSTNNTSTNSDGMCVYNGEFISREVRTPFEGYSCEDLQKEWKRIDLPLSNSPYKSHMRFIRTYSMDPGSDIEIKCTYQNQNKYISGDPESAARDCGQYVEKTKKDIADFDKEVLQRKAIENERKVKLEKQYNTKVAEIKKNRQDESGKFGFHFKMNHTEAKKICNGTKFEMAPLNFVCYIDGKTINLKFSELLQENGPWPEAFINVISLSVGSYTADDFEKYYDKLDDKYDELYRPSKGDVENFIKGFNTVTYYFENDSNDKTPRYIGLHLTPAGGANAFMYVQYFDRNYFKETIIKAKEKKKKDLDDL